METLATLTSGEIVLVSFPFSDISESILRPAVVLTTSERGDWILCQITSNPQTGIQSIGLTNNSFVAGSLNLTSYVLPDKLFTAHHNIIVTQIGTMKITLFEQIIESGINIFKASLPS